MWKSKKVISGLSGTESGGQYVLKKKEPTLKVEDNMLTMLEAESYQGCMQLK